MMLERSVVSFPTPKSNACRVTEKCCLEKENGNIVGVYKGKCRFLMVAWLWLVARAVQPVRCKYSSRINININIWKCRIGAEYVSIYVQCLGDGDVGWVKHGTLGVGDWSASVYP